MPSNGAAATMVPMTTRIRSVTRAHPTLVFFCLAFATSWTLMTPAMVAGLDSLAAIPFFLGVWAPAAAAAIVVRVTGGSIKAWLRDIMGWRVRARYYVVALGVPIARAHVAHAGVPPGGARPRVG